MTDLSRRDFLSAAAVTAIALPAAAAAEKSSQRRIKIGQIGVGHAHASKLAVYRRSPDYEVVGIVEPDDELRDRAQTQPAYQDLPWMTREQLLNVPDLQAVLVETSNPLRTEDRQATVCPGLLVENLEFRARNSEPKRCNA